MPQPALIRLARPASSRRLGPILPHARAPPPVQVRHGRHVGTPPRELHGLPQKGDRDSLLKMTSDERGNR
jgi:hypothetical protein